MKFSKCKKEAFKEAFKDGLCKDHYNFILAGKKSAANNFVKVKKGSANNE